MKYSVYLLLILIFFNYFTEQKHNEQKDPEEEELNDIQKESSKAELYSGAKYLSSGGMGDQISAGLLPRRSTLNNPMSANPNNSSNPGSLSGTVAIINIPDSTETLGSQTAGTSSAPVGPLEPELAI